MFSKTQKRHDTTAREAFWIKRSSGGIQNARNGNSISEDAMCYGKPGAMLANVLERSLAPDQLG
jgi:hypothetical protein